jgi:hypothetical protein
MSDEERQTIEHKLRKFPQKSVMEVEFDIRFVETREFKIRKKIAVWLMGLAARVLGTGIKYLD